MKLIKAFTKAVLTIAIAIGAYKLLESYEISAEHYSQTIIGLFVISVLTIVYLVVEED